MMKKKKGSTTRNMHSWKAGRRCLPRQDKTIRTDLHPSLVGLGQFGEAYDGSAHSTMEEEARDYSDVGTTYPKIVSVKLVCVCV
jgi:hypothetical protein